MQFTVKIRIRLECCSLVLIISFSPDVVRSANTNVAATAAAGAEPCRIKTWLPNFFATFFPVKFSVLARPQEQLQPEREENFCTVQNVEKTKATF